MITRFVPGFLIFTLALFSLDGAQRLEFDVTSVKVNRRPFGQRDSALECSPGGYFTARGLSLRPIVLWAYHLQFFQLSNIPTPVAELLFDIEAKAASGPVSLEQCRQMTQALLKDRFRLSVHPETKSFDVYALVVDKGGIKMTKVTDDVREPGVGITVNGKPYPLLPPEGWSMERLREVLGGAAIAPDRPLVDRTGLEGYYKVALNIDIPNTDLFTAARRLGLRAEARKERLDFIVVDNIELPDEN